MIFGTAFPAPFAAPAFAWCAIMICTSGIQVGIADETDNQGAYYDWETRHIIHTKVTQDVILNNVKDPFLGL